MNSKPYTLCLTSTGKERDEETGYNYHGARYYDATLLTCFISIDQYADKYPTLSSYHYCAWNPVKIIDPTGDTVVLSSTANEIHMLYYNKNKEYTDLYDKLHSCRDKLFIVGDINETPDVSGKEGGTVLDYIPDEGSVYEGFSGEIYSVQWGDAQPEYGGDKSHVFLEELFHAGQILQYGNNDGTIEREYDAKSFAIGVNPSISTTCTDNRGFSGIPTQLGIISQESKPDACKFLKSGRTVQANDIWGNLINNVIIPGAYRDFPDK